MFPSLFNSVFWDLYCAAPERRDTCEHSSEAKAFHDYVSIYFDFVMIVDMNPVVVFVLPELVVHSIEFLVHLRNF